MTKRLLAVITLCLVGLARAGAEVAAPALPKNGKALTDFVPSGWKILKRAEGDLNKDNVPDAVLILASIQEDAVADAPRPLLMLLKQADGSYTLSGSNPELIRCKTCGGVFGDPLDDLKIERGTVVISHYGGSRERWGESHRFRFQDGDWYLIGHWEMWRDNLSGEIHTMDENLITGDTVKTHIDENDKKSVEKTKVAKTPLARLQDVKRRQ